MEHERQMATEQGMDPESVAYNVNLAFRVEGILDSKKLQDASVLIFNHAQDRGNHINCCLPEASLALSQNAIHSKEG